MHEWLHLRRHATVSSCTRIKVHATSDCGSASHANVVASIARHPCRLRPQSTGRQQVVGRLVRHQRTCTERDGSALRHSVHSSQSCTTPNDTMQGGRAA
eukprot:2013799-Alexandrium_andersonii.AAC.1